MNGYFDLNGFYISNRKTKDSKNAIKCLCMYVQIISWLFFCKSSAHTRHYNFNCVSNIWMQLIHPLSIRQKKWLRLCNAKWFWVFILFSCCCCFYSVWHFHSRLWANLLEHDVLNYCLVKWRPSHFSLLYPHIFFPFYLYCECAMYFDKACKTAKRKISESAIIYDLHCGSLRVCMCMYVVVVEFT